jgi:nucleoside-diphosphate-sugar epimerase
MAKPSSHCISPKNTCKTIHSMSVVLVLGCGDLGGEIARRLSSQHRVFGVRASCKPVPEGVELIQADVTQPTSLKPLTEIRPNLLIYCVAASEQTDASYRQHYVEGLRNVLATQVDNSDLQHVFFVSSTRVYGQSTAGMVDESMPAVPIDFGGERLLEAEALLKSLPCQSTVLRLSGIYGTGRLFLVNLAKSPERWPQTNAWTNRIHRDDAAGFIAYLCEKVFNHQAVDDCYIVTDDMPVPQREVLQWLAGQQGVDTSEVGNVSVGGGKRLSNQRLRSAGFELMYPDFRAGYARVLSLIK